MTRYNISGLIIEMTFIYLLIIKDTYSFITLVPPFFSKLKINTIGEPTERFVFKGILHQYLTQHASKLSPTSQLRYEKEMTCNKFFIYMYFLKKRRAKISPDSILNLGFECLFFLLYTFF